MLIMVLNRKVFTTPALGTFLNPFIGVVQSEKNSGVDKEITLGLNGAVDVLFDDRSVPHIFADNQDDLFFVQGYVTASDRLWQMDFLSYASAGRLCEIFGEEFLNYDRNQRREGMLRSALNSLAFIEQDAETKNALDNYTAGVNACINALEFESFPLEYKLIGYSPEPWTNLKSVLIMKYMSALLSGYEEDVSATYMQMVLGAEEYDQLFASFTINPDSMDFGIQRIMDTLPANNYIDYSFLEAAPNITASNFNPRLGSNSWAIAPEKSKSGSAMLATDPHLNLSLPAIWYELQLKSEDQNVYGYAIPGVPGIVIGYNENISWGLTNGSTDVRDYYKLELKDDYSYYKYDGEWLATEMYIEEIKIRDEHSFFDTMFYAKQGVISSDFRFGNPDTKGCALDWTLHDPSNEFLTFLKMNKAKEYSDFKEAIKHYQCPVQNFSYADVQGNIGMHHQGKIIESTWKNRGKFILDGSNSSQFDHLTIKKDLPFDYNPEKGYVYSANNNPYGVLDSVNIYGHYAELRADKIDAILANKKNLTVDDMTAMQLDNTNRLAELAIPILLESMANSEHKYIKLLESWNYKYDADDELGLLFEQWWRLIQENTWDELLKYEHFNDFPKGLVLLDLIKNDPDNPYFDLLATDERETARDIIELSFNEVWYAPGIYYNWGSFNKVNLNHLSNIVQFSKLGIEQGGHPNALNAISTNWGPSLRMVVDMGERPKGYGIYAGGQSGNPASQEYDRFIGDWANGIYYELNFYENKEAAKAEKNYAWFIK